VRGIDAGLWNPVVNGVVVGADAVRVGVIFTCTGYCQIYLMYCCFGYLSVLQVGNGLKERRRQHYDTRSSICRCYIQPATFSILQWFVAIRHQRFS